MRLARAVARLWTDRRVDDYPDRRDPCLGLPIARASVSGFRFENLVGADQHAMPQTVAALAMLLLFLPAMLADEFEVSLVFIDGFAERQLLSHCEEHSNR